MPLLYLVRHAEAADLGEGAAACDADRELTPKGRRQACSLAKFLQASGADNPLVVSSPLLRAIQTAEILARRLSEDGPSVLPSLAPGGKPEGIIRTLRSLGGRDLVAVGHMPDLATAVAWFIGAPLQTQIAFKKSGTAAIRFDKKIARGVALLEWLIQPRLIKGR